MIRDDDAEAFFRLGDAGIYADGPHSLAPTSLDDGGEELAMGVTTEQLERRDRLKRIVTTVVGVLGAGVMVLLPFKLGAFAGSPQKLAAVPPPVIVEPRFVPPTAAAERVASPEAPAIAVTTQSAPAVVAPEPALAALPAATPAPAEVRRAFPRRVSAARSPVRALPAASKDPVRVLSPGHAHRGAHVPPTASFPD